MSNSQNTTSKGDRFEDKAREIICKVVEEERLGVLKDYIRIFSKKRYISQKRDHQEIEFDLSIEVWPPDAKRFVSLYLIECKDYESRVPVGKIEEFLYKVDEVAGVNVKAIFISDSPLQEAAFSIAKNVGMMVIQGESKDNFKIILHKTNRDGAANGIPFIQNTIQSNMLDEGSKNLLKLIDDKILSSLTPITNISSVGYDIDRLSKEDIEKIANRELEKFNAKIFEEWIMLTAPDLINYLKKEYNIEFKYYQSDFSEMGYCNLETNTIGINKSLKGNIRELFIICHELGHYLLHQKLSIGQQIYDSFSDSEINFRTGRNSLTNPKHWIEWQANYFAACFLMPKNRFILRLHRQQRYFKMSPGVILLDHQSINVGNFKNLVKMLSDIFSVSPTTIIHRLNEFNQINDTLKLKTVGQIFDEYRDEFFI